MVEVLNKMILGENEIVENIIDIGNICNCWVEYIVGNLWLVFFFYLK